MDQQDKAGKWADPHSNKAIQSKQRVEKKEKGTAEQEDEAAAGIQIPGHADWWMMSAFVPEAN
ncbi:hypothetical protein N7486_006238 [Penicillium sp. IBT 16267x]|nr:hypothetical protein N7486_006238 [Penicillium sp. IBT 16267x]